MSSIIVLKGEPVTITIGVTDDDEPVDMNDGTWNVNVELRYQTKVGDKPFELEGTPSGNSVIVNLTSEQTSQLSHLGTGYVLVVAVDKIDDSVNLLNYVQVSVFDVL